MNPSSGWGLRLFALLLASKCKRGWGTATSFVDPGFTVPVYNESICLRTTLTVNSTNLEENDTNRSVEVAISNVPSICPDGTYISLTALDLNQRTASIVPDLASQNLMFTETPYRFQVNFEMDSAMFTVGNHSKQGFFFRFMMCDILFGGWCSPNYRPTEVPSSPLSFQGAEDVIYGLYNFTDRTVSSPWVSVNVSDQNGTIIQVDLDVNFQLSKAVPSRYYRLHLHTVLLLYDDDGFDDETNLTFVQRVDAATLGNPNAVVTRGLPKMLYVSDAMKILLYCMISVYGAMAVATLALLIYYRNHPAIQLAQGAFLMVIVAAALVGGTFTFTFLPHNDAYCLMRAPCVHLPIHLIGTILAARQWRTYVVLSGAMKVGRGATSKTTSRSSAKGWVERMRCLERLVACLTFLSRLDIVTRHFHKCKRAPEEKRRTSSIRQTATAADSARIVFFLVFPQTMLIIFGAIFDPPEFEVNYDESENIARSSCQRSAMWLSSLTMWLTAGSYILALLLAWVGKDLPSLFNEKKAIFNTSLIFAIVLFINIVVLGASENQPTTADTSVFVLVFTLLLALTVVLINIVWPKISRARRNEKIVLGEVLRLRSRDAEKEGDQQPNFMSRLIQHKDDALPRNIEELIYRLQKLFASIGEKCGYGTPLSKKEWQEMMRGVSKLNTELGRVTLDWNDVDDDVEDNPPRSTAVGTEQTEQAEFRDVPPNETDALVASEPPSADAGTTEGNGHREEGSSKSKVIMT